MNRNFEQYCLSFELNFIILSENFNLALLISFSNTELSNCNISIVFQYHLICNTTDIEIQYKYSSCISISFVKYEQHFWTILFEFWTKVHCLEWKHLKASIIVFNFILFYRIKQLWCQNCISISFIKNEKHFWSILFKSCLKCNSIEKNFLKIQFFSFNFILCHLVSFIVRHFCSRMISQ
jgi:hypothetical protein